jgi:hypothetical protein
MTTLMEHLQQYAKSSCHIYFLAKTLKYSSNSLAKDLTIFATWKSSLERVYACNSWLALLFLDRCEGEKRNK